LLDAYRDISMSRESPAERWTMNINEALMPIENSFLEEVAPYEKGAAK
jgi:hypothetical protein